MSANIINMAAEIFMKKIGSGNMDLGQVVSALKGLLPTSGDELDIGGLVSQITSKGGGLASLATSWLGDGDNMPIDAGQVMDMFGADKVSEFASSLGTDANTAAQGLSGMIPDLIDQSSKGGSLLGQGGGSMVGKLLGGLFGKK